MIKGGGLIQSVDVLESLKMKPQSVDVLCNVKAGTTNFLVVLLELCCKLCCRIHCRIW
jgi:hypothetical protein